MKISEIYGVVSASALKFGGTSDATISFGIYGTGHSTHACSATSRSSLLTVV
jgi:hypothetical protein